MESRSKKDKIRNDRQDWKKLKVAPVTKKITEKWLTLYGHVK